MPFLKKIINKIIYFFIPFSKNQRSNISEALNFLKGKNFYPRTVIDVGVAKGTRPLYVNFPKSFFLLIEPIDKYEKYLKRILKKYNGCYCLAAASYNEGTVKFNLHPNHMDGSSLLKEEIGGKSDGYEINVPTIKIDNLVEEKNLNAPFLIKVDVQGAELDVLKGSLNTLKKTDVIILEVSLFKFMKGAPDLYEVIVFMKDNGFVAYDILKGWYRPLDNALGQIDIVFVKENGIFRKDHRFATKSQLKKLGFI